MTMLTEVQFTKAREGLSTLYDDVVNTLNPAIIKRRQQEVMVMRVDLQKMLLSNFSLKPEILQEEDNSFTLALNQLEIYANGPTLNEAIDDLVSEMKQYALEYKERSQLFYNSPNRRSHFPYILRILLCNNEQEIRELLEI